jgi:hypothetical protein
VRRRKNHAHAFMVAACVMDRDRRAGSGLCDLRQFRHQGATAILHPWHDLGHETESPALRAAARLPAASIHDLPEIPGKISRVQDAWGRDIVMSFADGKATLTSLGRDGLPGGTGEDADMSGVFPLRDATGAWAAEDVDWIQEPQL